MLNNNQMNRVLNCQEKTIENVNQMHTMDLYYVLRSALGWKGF